MTDREVRLLGSGIMLLVLLFGRGALAADLPLGTVFYSPAERAELVAKRDGGTMKKGGAEDEGADQQRRVEQAPNSLPYTVTGFVKRSGGRSVLWLNGEPVPETTTDAGRPTFRLSRDHVVIDGKEIKVGETLDIISGKHVSPLPDGAIKVIP